MAHKNGVMEYVLTGMFLWKVMEGLFGYFIRKETPEGTPENIDYLFVWNLQETKWTKKYAEGGAKQLRQTLLEKLEKLQLVVEERNPRSFHDENVKVDAVFAPMSLLRSCTRFADSRRSSSPRERYTTPFSSGERQRIILKLLNSPESQIAECLFLCEKSRILQKWFPLHDSVEKQDLLKSWIASPDSEEVINDYFGSEIGFYFAWLNCYTSWLVWLGTLGLFAFLLEADFLFSFALSFASTLFLQRWKRRNAVVLWEWNVDDSEELEQSRIEFRGEWRTSPVTSKPELWYPERNRYLKYLVTVPVTLFAVMIIAVSMFFTLQLEDYFDVNYKDSVLSHSPTVLYALSIPLFTFLYDHLAVFLNDWENHRTQYEYSTALTVKLLVFQFFNNYLSLFFILFWKQDLERLKSQMAVVFVVKQVLSNFGEVAIPYVSGMFRQKSAQKNLQSSLNKYEREAQMEEYPGTFDDYLEMVVQFGYIFIFGWAWPLAPLLAYMNNVFELRSDLFKLCSTMQRPKQSQSRGIGVWFIALEVLAAVGVVTNVSYQILSIWKLQEPILMEYSMPAKICILMAVEHVIFALKATLALVIPDTPHHIRVLQAREKYNRSAQLGKLKHL